MKLKKLSILLGIVILISAMVGVTYMWFFSEANFSTGLKDAAYIDLITCTEEIVYLDPILPGQKIDLGKQIVWYKGSRDAIIQFKITGDGVLYPGSESHKDWKKLENTGILEDDYFFNGSLYQMTSKRLYEVLRLEDSYIAPGFADLYPSTHEPNMFYIHVTSDDSALLNLLKLVSLKVSGELGGYYQGSPSRQFEQRTTFSNTGVQITAVQVTPEAIQDILGTNALKDVQDMVQQGNFTPGEEWTYTG